MRRDWWMRVVSLSAFNDRRTRSEILLGAALGRDYEDGSGADEIEWDVIQYGPFLAWAFYI